MMEETVAPETTTILEVVTTTAILEIATTLFLGTMKICNAMEANNKATKETLREMTTATVNHAMDHTTLMISFMWTAHVSGTFFSAKVQEHGQTLSWWKALLPVSGKLDAR